MIADLNDHSLYSNYANTYEVKLVDDTFMPITHTGTYFSSRTFDLLNVLYIPTTKQNFLSRHQFMKNDNISLECSLIISC